MGEAKKRHVAEGKAACRCGSGLEGLACCWRPNGWHRTPSLVKLKDTGWSGSLSRCYLNTLNNCSDRLTGEHYVSKAILQKIGGEGGVDVSGFPWLPEGETRKVGISGLVSNNLCGTHNNSLSTLDARMDVFYQAVQQCLADRDIGQRYFLFSGHDIERWFLKTLAGLAASRNLANGRERLSGAFDENIDIPALLEDPLAWKAPAGLYFTQQLGTQFQFKNEFAIAPLTKRENGNLVGMMAQFQGLAVTVMMTPSFISNDAGLSKAIYRPDRLNFNMQSKYTFEISWER